MRCCIEYSSCRILLHYNDKEVFNVYEIEFNPPGLAQLEDSIPCDICGEKTMNSRLMYYENNSICIPCYKAQRK